MLRKIIKIDKEKCNGCGLCVSACQEGAIGIVDEKAELLRDDYCDGLGNCLPVCPTGAISFEEREAVEFSPPLPCGCPGTFAKSLQKVCQEDGSSFTSDDTAASCVTAPGNVASQLSQWPIQIKLVPVSASYFDNAGLLIAADCAAYAYGNFHNDFMRNKITLVGCPKLDEGDYSEKLTAILQANNIKSVTVARMEVPCCGGIENAVKTALKNSGKMIPWKVVVIGVDGRIVEEI